MASNLDFILYVCEQVEAAGVISYKKMFGEYMVYVDARPILLICDNTVFVKILPETTSILTDSNPKGYPYNGAKQHYVLDIDDRDKAEEVCVALKQVTPLPVKKKKKD